MLGGQRTPERPAAGQLAQVLTISVRSKGPHLAQDGTVTWTFSCGCLVDPEVVFAHCSRHPLAGVTDRQSL
jgi:hypothetical protein